MAINNLPASIADAIQTGFLERVFRNPLEAKLGFRAIADREEFSANIGESITKTRDGLLAPVTTPMTAASNTDITSGLTPQNYGLEQYTLSVNQYANQMMLNVVTAKVAIASLFLRNAKKLGENAYRSVDTIAQAAVYAAYMGGNTRVRVTLGAPATTVSVDDIRGFQTTLDSTGKPVPVSSSNSVLVVVNLNTYNLTGATADIVNVSTAALAGGVSGTLTFSTNVSVADATLNNTVLSSVAPLIVRPALSATNVNVLNTALINPSTCINNGKLTMQMILEGKAQMQANAVPEIEDLGYYICYADPIQLTGLYQDPAFQFFFRGKPDTKEYKRGVVSELLGVQIVETNMNPITPSIGSTGYGAIHRAIICGQGALVEGVFTREGYEAANELDDGNLTTIIDDIAHVTREPIDALKQVVTQTWSYIGGFVAPTDTTANATVIPTATNAAFKRACVLESL